MTSATSSATASTCHTAHLSSSLMGALQVDRPATAQTTISPHSLAYCAVGGGIWCCYRPETCLAPGPTGSYYLSGLTVRMMCVGQRTAGLTLGLTDFVS